MAYSRLARRYLILYNLTSCLLWFSILARLVLFVPVIGAAGIYEQIGQSTKWIQTMAILEILHAASVQHFRRFIRTISLILTTISRRIRKTVPRKPRLTSTSSFSSPSPTISQPPSVNTTDANSLYLQPQVPFSIEPHTQQTPNNNIIMSKLPTSSQPQGLVRAPLITTTMQVASRILLIWGVIENYTMVTTTRPYYSTMLLAWSVTEVIRYGYFFVSLRSTPPATANASGKSTTKSESASDVPAWLTWLRYNTFFVLYPLGIGSECVNVWLASTEADELVKWILYAILAIYVPGSYILYTHMMKQRRKVIKGKTVRRD